MPPANHPVGAALDQLIQKRLVTADVVRYAGEDQRVAVGARFVRRGGKQLAEKGVGDFGQADADELRMPLVEASGRDAWLVVVLLYDFEYLPLFGGAGVWRFAEGAGNCGDGYPRLAGYIEYVDFTASHSVPQSA